MLHLPRSVVVQTSAIVGIAYTGCEWLSGLPFEVKAVWSGSNVPLHLKLIFILSRYLGLFGHVLYILAFNYVSQASKPTQLLCETYWSCQQYACSVSMCLLSILSAERVYALWGRDLRMGLLLSLVVASHLIFRLAVGTYALRSVTYNNSSCFNIDLFPKEVMYMSLSDFVVHSCIWVLGHLKCTSIKQGIRSVDTVQLISRVSRESFIIAVFACVVPVVLMVDGLWTKLAAQLTMITYITFPAYLSITTSLTCRAIKNLHNVSRKVCEDIQSTGNGENLALTSISIEESRSLEG